jgi:hypothetical protein
MIINGTVLGWRTKLHHQFIDVADGYDWIVKVKFDNGVIHDFWYYPNLPFISNERVQAKKFLCFYFKPTSLAIVGTDLTGEKKK